MGTGPFLFEEWVRDDHLSLKRNDKYWEKGLPYADKLIYKAIPDQVVKLTNLKSGALDVIDDVLPKDVAALKTAKDLVFSEIPSYEFNALRLNTTKSPLTIRPFVRPSLMRLTMRLSGKIFFTEQAFRATALYCSQLGLRSQELPVHLQPGEGESQKLKEGGKPEGFKFKIYTKISADRRPGLPGDSVPTSAPWGFETEIVQLEGTLHLKTMLDKDYEANYGLWSGYGEPDTNLYRQFHPKGSAQWTGYTHPRVTELLEQARASLKQAESKESFMRKR